MSGHVQVAGLRFRNSYVPTGHLVEINYRYRCAYCADTGVQLDDNDEPVEFCDCVVGEAISERDSR